MTNNTILNIIREVSLIQSHEFDAGMLESIAINNRKYEKIEFDEFKRDLIEAGSKVRIQFLEYRLNRNAFDEFIAKETEPILYFIHNNEDIEPVLSKRRKNKINAVRIDQGEALQGQYPYDQLIKTDDEVIVFVIMPYQSLISEYAYSENFQGEKINPLRRFFRLLSTERKDILYIIFYSIVIGLLGLVLPLGIQTTVELISGGVFFSSVYLLIGIVILGVLIGGILQIVQISLVEHLQRRVFTKASFEFAFRIPRLRTEAILQNYAPELVNRFFEILTIQKGLPKVLIDFASGVIQIFFGLVLLSLYHPFFVFFSIVLVAILTLIFYSTGRSGLESSINESKYKYKVAQWLEELARAMNSFKLAGTTDLPIRKTDYTVNNYLKYRKKHFSVLVTQFSFIVFFKAAVTGCLLIMGTILVVDRQITLGQFVASEVIVILILSSVEKIIMYMDVIYDLLTAVDKLSQVTDLPLERVGGVDLPRTDVQDGYRVDVRNLSYRYPDSKKQILRDVSLSIAPSEHICIAGPGGTGKTTLTNIIAGLHSGFEGSVTINDYSIRDLDLSHLRDRMAKNISAEDIFDGTILENITIGKSMESPQDVIDALQAVGAYNEIIKLPDGLSTHLVSGGKGFPSSLINKIILARCLAKKPRLIILNDFFSGIKKQDKLDLLKSLTGPAHPWTLIAVSNDPVVMAACDRVVIINNGVVETQGSFKELIADGAINNYLD
jgi:ABC-type bacteriocin/lantibiotic exporter with double-glycine peptidase domain